jgi:hypothetical protein
MNEESLDAQVISVLIVCVKDIWVRGFNTLPHVNCYSVKPRSQINVYAFL